MTEQTIPVTREIINSLIAFQLDGLEGSIEEYERKLTAIRANLSQILLEAQKEVLDALENMEYNLGGIKEYYEGLKKTLAMEPAP